MKKFIKTTGKVVATCILVAIALGASVLLQVGDSPPFQTVPEYYFLKALGIKLLGIIIIVLCIYGIAATWGKLKEFTKALAKPN